MFSTPSKESLAFNDVIGKLIEGAEKPGSVAEAAMIVIVGLKEEAQKHSPIGNAVTTLLTRIGTMKEDDIFKGVGAMDRMQIMQMAYMAVKMCE